MSTPIQARVLDAAVTICRERGAWTFDVGEIVKALPDLNAQSVRTHVTSRCCANAPANHAHRWAYFRRIGRGRYEVVPAHRRTESHRAVVREAQTLYAAGVPAVRTRLHAVISRSDGWYVAEVLELPVVTQAPTLDALVGQVKDAIAVHLQGEDRGVLGIAPHPSLALSYETSL